MVNEIFLLHWNIISLRMEWVLRLQQHGFRLMQFKLFLGCQAHPWRHGGREQAAVELYVLESVSHSLLHKEGCFFLVCRACRANSVSGRGWKARKWQRQRVVVGLAPPQTGTLCSEKLRHASWWKKRSFAAAFYDLLMLYVYAALKSPAIKEAWNNQYSVTYERTDRLLSWLFTDSPCSYYVLSLHKINVQWTTGLTVCWALNTYNR